jgi:signal recognition particle subunit SRP54
MGDMLSLIEKAEKAYDQDVAAEAADKLMTGTFNLNDFLEQFQQIKKMGSLSSLLSMMGGLPAEVRNAKIDDKDISKIEAIIRSMTFEERVNPAVLNGSRRLRIANGAGVSTTEVNNLINQFNQAKKLAGAWGFGKLGMKKKTGSNKKKTGGGRYTPKGSKR